MELFKNTNNKNLLLSCLEDIENKIVNNMYCNCGIEKYELIDIAKSKKQKFPEEWNKLRKKFGNILKLLKISEKKQDIWDEEYKNSKSFSYYIYKIWVKTISFTY